MLLTHIRFLKSLRSTASPILSHFHTLLHHKHSLLPLQRLEPTPVKHSIFYQMLQSQYSLRTFSSHNFQLLMWSNPSIAFVIQVSIISYSGLVICTRMGQRNTEQRFKDPRHKSFLYEGVCSFVCVHHDPGFYSCTGDWVNEIACLPREARVPEDWRETTPSLLPGHVTRSKSGNQKPKQPPWLCLPPCNILLKIHQLTRKEVKCRAASTETSRFHFSETVRNQWFGGLY